MLPTPDTSHVSFKTIYEPAEDSFLLLDTLSSASESAWLTQRFANHTPFAVEVGTGSGVVISFLSANAETILQQPVVSLGIDVNVNACKATVETVRKAIADQTSTSSYLGSLQGDLLSSLRPGSVDILIFNPPYVPSEELPQLPNANREYRDAFEQESHLISLSFDGGADGMETTTRFLDHMTQVLSPNGVCYLLLCAQNKPDNVKQTIEDLAYGPWKVDTVGSSGKKAGWEKLVILRIWRDP